MSTASGSSRPSVRRDLGWLLFFGLMIFGAGLGLKNPWPPDAPRFAMIARDMALSGQWLLPLRAGEIYPDKPPLFMWEQAAFYRLTGSLRLSHALPSMLAGLLVLFLVWDLARRLWNRRVAWWAGLTLLAIVQFPMQAKTGQIDATLCLWTTIGLYGLCRHLLLGPAWPWCWTACAAMGFGIITKGVGFLPILILLPWAWAKLRDWPRLPAAGGWRWWLGLVAALGAIATWLLPMLIATATSADPAVQAYRDEILLRQTAERYADSWAHVKPIWYYLTSVVPFLWLPISLFLPWLVPAWRRRLARRDARYLLLLGWIVAVLFFFSLSPGKRGVYLLPAVPALALAAAPLMAGLWRLRGAQRAAQALVASLSVLLLAVTAVAIGIRPEKVVELDAEYGGLPWTAPAVYGGLGLLLLFFLGRRQSLTALWIHLCSFWLLLGWWIYPVLDPVRSGRELMQRVSSSLEPSEELAMLGWREQMILHADRPVTHFGYHRNGDVAVQEAAASWLLAAPGRRLLLPRRFLEPCFGDEGAAEVGLGHRHEWLLVEGQSVETACVDAPRGVDGEVRSYRSRAPDRE